MEGPDYILDIEGLRSPAQDAAADTGAAQPPGARPWVAIHWKCCHVYSRVYRNADGTAYEGRCPRCGASARLLVGPAGTSTRFFQAE